MSTTHEMSAGVRRAMDKLWPQVHQAAREQYAIIANYTVSDTDDAASRFAARNAAHKINGALGTFGRHDASKVAAAIESLLAADSVEGAGADLAGLLAQLDVLIC